MVLALLAVARDLESGLGKPRGIKLNLVIHSDTQKRLVARLSYTLVVVRWYGMTSSNRKEPCPSKTSFRILREGTTLTHEQNLPSTMRRGFTHVGSIVCYGQVLAGHE